MLRRHGQGAWESFGAGHGHAQEGPPTSKGVLKEKAEEKEGGLTTQAREPMLQPDPPAPGATPGAGPHPKQTGMKGALQRRGLEGSGAGPAEALCWATHLAGLVPAHWPVLASILGPRELLC